MFTSNKRDKHFSVFLSILSSFRDPGTQCTSLMATSDDTAIFLCFCMDTLGKTESMCGVDSHLHMPARAYSLCTTDAIVAIATAVLSAAQVTFCN